MVKPQMPIAGPAQKRAQVAEIVVVPYQEELHRSFTGRGAGGGAGHGVACAFHGDWLRGYWVHRWSGAQTWPGGESYGKKTGSDVKMGGVRFQDFEFKKIRHQL